MRSKRWSKCITVRKTLFKKHRFSTQAFEPEPVIHYDMTLDGSLLQPDNILRNFHKMEIKTEDKNEDNEEQQAKEHRNEEKLQSPDENATYTTALHIADPTLNKRYTYHHPVQYPIRSVPCASSPPILLSPFTALSSPPSPVLLTNDVRLTKYVCPSQVANVQHPR